MEQEIKTYEAGNNRFVLERIFNFLENKFSYGFSSERYGSTTRCFFDKENITAQIYENGKIELSANVDSSIANYVERELNYSFSIN